MSDPRKDLLHYAILCRENLENAKATQDVESTYEWEEELEITLEALESLGITL